MGQCDFKKKCSGVELDTSHDIRLRTFSGEVMKAVGVAEVEVCENGISKRLPIVVTPGNTPSLFGRNWLKHIPLDWNKIVQIHNMADVSSEKPRELENVLKEYEGVFSDGLGKFKNVEVHIDLKEGVSPRFVKARPVPYAIKEDIEREIERLVEEGIYEPVPYSDWACPIVPIRKPDGSIRICGDYKMTINPRSKCDTYPVPKTEDLLATLNGGQKFTKLDLKQAYMQLCVDKVSAEYLTVNTHKGLFRPTRLMFGLHSAAGVFQREIEKRLSGVPGVIVRSDDILITGVDDATHLSSLRKVLQVLAENGLKVKLPKCKFFEPEVEYMGFKVNKDGVDTISEKIAPILEAPAPLNQSQLKSFLGMIQYYHRHLRNLADKLEPLHKLLRKRVEWEWGEEQEKAFVEVKEMLTSPEFLIHYDPSLPIIIHCDASPYGLGAVLSHSLSKEIERPVCFGSRTLSKAERGYGQVEREGLAVVFAVKKFHQYIYGQFFYIYTDHKPLIGILGETRPIPALSAPRIQRWALILAAYNYELKYRKGEQNGNADFFSRLPRIAWISEVSNIQNEIYMVVLEHSPVTAVEVKRETFKDPVLSRVHEFVLLGWPDEFEAEQVFQPYSRKRDELTVEDGCVLLGCRVVVPEKLREKVLDELHVGHVGICRMKMLARSFVWWPSLDDDVEHLCKECEACALHQNNPNHASVHPWEVPSRPWERVHVDFAGPYLGKMFLLLIDAFSKWMEVFIVSSASSEQTIEKLRMCFSIVTEFRR